MATIRALQENPGLGAFRMHAALKQLGIALSPSTCGRIMALNRKLYDLTVVKPVPKPRKPMPFAATRSHQYWSVDIRYIERHHVPEYAHQPIYIITILDNYSRAIVASAPSPTQNLDAFLLVLFTAIHVHGAPEALVSDGGSVFRANQSLEIYERLSIRKEQIERRRPYQNYVETHFNILRRMADYYFERATSWEEFCAIHAKFVADYNWQEHAAHRDREESQRAPREVLAWFRGRQVEREVLGELFRALHHLRHIDRHGYIQYRYWRLYGEEALAGKEVAVWLFRDTLTIAYDEEPAVQYAVTYDTDAPGVEAFRRPRPYQTFASVDELRSFPSHDSRNSHGGTSQAPLWDREILHTIGWRKIIQVTPRPRTSQRRSPIASSGLVATHAYRQTQLFT
jgi:transposase InsO family protein